MSSGTIRLDTHDHGLWRRAWAAAAAGACSPLVLLDALMLLPASSAAAPPAREFLLALNRIVIDAGAPSSLAALEKIADALDFRLHTGETMGDEAASIPSVALELENEFSQAASRLLSQPDCETMRRTSTLLGRVPRAVHAFVQSLATAEQNKHLSSEQSLALAATRPGGVRRAWHGWHEVPTVGWLLRGEWLDAPQLRSRYDSVEEYTETLQRLVTLLTFYHGAGAVWPKCRTVQGSSGGGGRGGGGRGDGRGRGGGGGRGDDDANNKCCGQPLIAVCTPDSRRCATRGCDKPALWRCTQPHHQDAVCASCCRQQQAALIGDERPSTDIYDAFVEREKSRHEGQIFILSQLRSRRPPNIGPNWRTTYRLKCPALVGVVRLGATGETLRPDQPLQWAEIVPVSTQEGASFDFQQREHGRIALRPLTRADVGVLDMLGAGAGTDAPLDVGTRVAVIDLQVFVPEVISVLATIFDPSLNQQLAQIPFADQLVGAEAPLHALSLPPGATCETAITEAIRDSAIDPLRRLPPTARDALCGNLARLGSATNLYGTQLAAFSEALRCPLHCTQGPPGTGKVRSSRTIIYLLSRAPRVTHHNISFVNQILLANQLAACDFFLYGQGCCRPHTIIFRLTARCRRVTWACSW